MLAGGIWGGIAGFLKAHLNVNEILSTIMLNYIAVFGMNYLLRGPMMDSLQIKLGVVHSTDGTLAARGRSAAADSYAPALGGGDSGSPRGGGVRSSVADDNRVPHSHCRANLRAALAAGINTKRYMVLSLVLAGTFAGLGGAVEVLGLHHRMFTDG